MKANAAEAAVQPASTRIQDRVANPTMIQPRGSADMVGRFLPVRIVAARTHSLRGELVDAK